MQGVPLGEYHVTIVHVSVADPGFPVGGGMDPLGGGHGPLMRVLFGKNVCKNERIGSHKGACTPHAP